MTCIVGYEHGGKVYIGGYSAGVDERYALTVRADAKVFVKDRMVMGFTSSFRMGQLLRYKLVVPRQGEEQDDMDFMVSDFVEAVRRCLKDGGFARIENCEESGGTFLVGYKGALYVVEGDFQVGRSTLPYHAVGCGDLIALGAMYVSREVEPEAKVNGALAAAEQMSGGVRSPFLVMSA